MPRWEYVSLEVAEAVATITLDRPTKLNAMTAEFGYQFHEAVVEATDRLGAACLVITGSSRAFSVGADRSVIGQPKNEARPSGWLCLNDCDVPTIAAVSGHAIGGGFELALLCDLIVAAPNAQFSLPEVGLGIIPGMGGTQALSRRVGQGIARDLLLTGRALTAAEAERLGIVARVSADNDVLPTAQALARDIARKPRRAVSAARRAVSLSSLPLADALEKESALFRELTSLD